MVQHNRPGEFWTAEWFVDGQGVTRLELGAWIAALLVFSESLAWLVSLSIVAATGSMCFWEPRPAVLAIELALLAVCTWYGISFLVQVYRDTLSTRRPRTNRPLATA